MARQATDGLDYSRINSVWNIKATPLTNPAAMSHGWVTARRGFQHKITGDNVEKLVPRCDPMSEMLNRGHVKRCILWADTC